MENCSFEVGKRYKVTITDFYEDCGLFEVGQQFTCHLIDDYGDCWTKDVLFKSYNNQWKSGLWCVATIEHLMSGDVVEV